jgi:hypothetical protein
MNKKLFIYHQTQLGDHILCYSIIKYYAKQYDEIIVFVRPLSDRHIQNLKRLYSSLPNVNMQLSSNHEESLNFINSNKDNKYLIFGHEDYRNALAQNNNLLRFDKYFYEKAGVPFENKWNEFYFERDLEKEKYIFYDIFKLKDDQSFIFLQEDPSRIFLINRNYIDFFSSILESSKFPEVNIFDFLYTIEHAKQVHFINSAFLTFIDIMQIKHDNLFYHKYVRPSEHEQPHLKLNWKIIE